MNLRIQFFVFALVFGFSLRAAHAEETDAATQEAAKLYKDAAKDMELREYSRACPKLEAARKIVPGHVRTAMSLAECYDKLGQPATALEVFKTARSIASAQGKADKVAEIDAKVEAIRPRVPHLTIIVPKGIASLPGLSLVRNDVPIPVSQWGAAVPINPGKYVIEVTALDKAPWKAPVEIEIGKDATVEVSPPWNEPAKTGANPQDGNRSQDTGSTSSGRSGLRTAGFVGIGLGAVGLGVGAVLGGLAVSKNNESDDGHCKPDNHCDQIGFDLRTEGRTLGNASTAAFVLGGVFVAAGVISVVVSGKSKEASGNAPQASFWVGPSGLGVRGRW
jgi:hypothetical protein